jgi:hypothetical protein
LDGGRDSVKWQMIHHIALVAPEETKTLCGDVRADRIAQAIAIVRESH